MEKSMNNPVDNGVNNSDKATPSGPNISKDGLLHKLETDLNAALRKAIEINQIPYLDLSDPAVISATKSDLEKAIADGTLDSNLFNSDVDEYRTTIFVTYDYLRKEPIISKQVGHGFRNSGAKKKKGSSNKKKHNSNKAKKDNTSLNNAQIKPQYTFAHTFDRSKIPNCDLVSLPFIAYYLTPEFTPFGIQKLTFYSRVLFKCVHSYINNLNDNYLLLDVPFEVFFDNLGKRVCVSKLPTFSDLSFTDKACSRIISGCEVADFIANASIDALKAFEQFRAFATDGNTNL